MLLLGSAPRHSRRQGLVGRAVVEYAQPGRSIHRVISAAERSELGERPEAKTGRNDPCPCESGKKFKRCCGTETRSRASFVTKREKSGRWSSTQPTVPGTFASSAGASTRWPPDVIHRQFKHPTKPGRVPILGSHEQGLTAAQGSIGHGRSQDRSGRCFAIRGRSCFCNSSRIRTFSRRGSAACARCHAALLAASVDGTAARSLGFPLRRS